MQFLLHSFATCGCFCRQLCCESTRWDKALQRFTACSLVHTILMHAGLMHRVLLRYSSTRLLYSHIAIIHECYILLPHDCLSTATLLHYCHVLLHTLATLRHYCYTTSTLRVNSHKKHIILLHYIPQHCNTTATLLHYWPHYCRTTALHFLCYTLHYSTQIEPSVPLE